MWDTDTSSLSTVSTSPSSLLPSLSTTVLPSLPSLAPLIPSSPPYLESIPSSSLLGQITLSIFLVLLCLVCVVGNLLVILAVCLERELRGRPQCYLIFSLAVADLVVGLFVCPLYTWSTVRGAWTLGVFVCDMWISVDVLMCTASILHLVAIALDRLWSITDISYAQNRTPRRVVSMLAVIWFLSLLITLAPFAGWKDEAFTERVEKQHVCLMSQQISYQVFSTATAFYIPLLCIIVVYWKIMRAAKKRFKRERDRRTVHRAPLVDASKKVPLMKKNSVPKSLPAPPPPAVLVPSLDAPTANGVSTCKESTSSASEEDKLPVGGTGESETRLDSVVLTNNGKAKGNKGMVSLTKKKKKQPKESMEMKRERKAWRTLAIITGSFVTFWTPFFLVSLVRPICHCTIPTWIESVTTWLGYLNSAVNPLIYTVFSQDFRAAFKKILKRLCFINDY